MIDTLRLTAEEARRLVDAERDLRRRALRRLSRRDRRARSRAARLPARLRRPGRRRDPDRDQGRDRDEGRADDGRLEDPRELRARCSTRPLSRRCKSARAAPARQDEHRRVRDGLVDGELRVRPVAQPVGPDARAGRLRRRLAPRRCPAGSRRGRSAPTPAARSSSPLRSAVTSACGRPTAPSRATASSRSRRRSTRSGRSRRTSATARFLYSIIAGRDENDSTTVDVPAVELPTAEDLKGLRIGVPKEMNEADGHRAGRDRSGARGDRARRVARRGGGGVLAAAFGRVRRRLLLPRRARGGVRRTSHATTAFATGCAATAPTSARC